jgi:hypothetical protein
MCAGGSVILARRSVFQCIGKGPKHLASKWIIYQRN